MTEPTRDALHAETLHYLEFQRDDKLRIDANRTAMGMVPSPAWKRDAEMYAYAAECVKRVPELEAEVERLRARVEVLRGFATHKDWCLASARGVSDRHCNCELAAATREGTDNG